MFIIQSHTQSPSFLQLKQRQHPHEPLLSLPLPKALSHRPLHLQQLQPSK